MRSARTFTHVDFTAQNIEKNLKLALLYEVKKWSCIFSLDLIFDNSHLRTQSI